MGIRKIPLVVSLIGKPTEGAGRESRSHAYRPGRRPRVLTLEEGGVSVAVMIGPLRGPDQLEAIHRWHYYHVPVSAIAEKRTALDVIAFYEAATRFNRPVGLIQAYATVLRVSRVRRKDLPGLAWPGRQGDAALYYRFDLGPIRLLAQPITNPEGQRLVFRFADLAKLETARTIRDLGRSASPGAEAPEE